ncbi:MAG: exonuclease subunit SbcD [Candidatus Rifleibacteriota bacterium]
MRFLHTSDWHLGQNLLSRSRQSEHISFFNWLFDQIEQHKIDALLVAGDIFDCGAPPGYAQRAYYDFLSRLISSSCSQAFIIGGNHDSPTFLEASRRILDHLQIHVIGRACESLDDMIFELKGKSEQVEALLCAVPFLRDREVRKSLAGESSEEKIQALNLGIAELYKNIAFKARSMAEAEGKKLPVIGMGHLFVSGCSLSESVREFSAGNLTAVHSDDFNDLFDYFALGHLHIGQKVAGKNNIRYSGSPIPMSFDECTREKIILLGDTDDPENLQEIKVPVFQEMRLIRGDLSAIIAELAELKKEATGSIWVEVQCHEEREIPLLSQTIHQVVEESNIEVLAVRHIRKQKATLEGSALSSLNLKELDPVEVFARRLDSETDYSEEEIKELKHAFNTILEEIHQGQDA